MADALVAHLEGAAANEDLGGFIAAAEMATNRAASSTPGTLLATAGTRAGKVAKGEARPTDGRLAEMPKAVEGMRERGKASLGDEANLDALFPAADVFAAAREAGAPVVRRLVGAAGPRRGEAAREQVAAGGDDTDTLSLGARKFVTGLASGAIGQVVGVAIA